MTDKKKRRRIAKTETLEKELPTQEVKQEMAESKPIKEEKEPVDPSLPNSNIDKMFPEGGPGAVVKLTPDQKLAQYVGQEELGTAGLENISVRGDIAAGDNPQEKINAFS